MRVLVLGATGFIGTRIVDELVLRHGAGVRATVRDYRKAVRLGRLPVEWVEAPATDPQAMREAVPRVRRRRSLRAPLFIPERGAGARPLPCRGRGRRGNNDAPAGVREHDGDLRRREVEGFG